jgi:hypothetical protein
MLVSPNATELPTDAPCRELRGLRSRSIGGSPTDRWIAASALRPARLLLGVTLARRGLSLAKDGSLSGRGCRRCPVTGDSP